MFKISFEYDLFNNDPKKRKKIKGITITHGYNCLSSCWCDCQAKCKYKSKYTFHNFSVNVHRFFEYRLHIKLPHLIYIQRKSVDLSGTTKCPFKKGRRYTCWDCKYTDGQIHGYCLNKKYINSTIEERKCNDSNWKSPGRCKFFEKGEFADSWDRKTGEHIFEYEGVM